LDTAEYARKHIGLDTLGYEENRNLARTLREYQKYPEAIQKFKLASSLNAYNWFSEWGLATCYAYQKDYALAIETAEGAKKIIRDGDIREDDLSIPNLDRELAEWNGYAGNIDRAAATYKTLLQDNPNDYETALSLMILFHNEKDHEGLLRFLESLKESTDERTGLDRRTQTFHAHYNNKDYHTAIYALCSNTNGFDPIFESYEAAINAAKARLAEARKTGDSEEEEFARACQATLMVYLANLCYDNSTETPERKEIAIDQWVRILQMDDSSGDYTLTSVKSYVRSKLASICYIEACRDTGAAGPYLEQLEQLAALKSASVVADWCDSPYPTRLVARYYALQGDKEKAKDALRAHVKANLDILLDDDPLNDWQGYQGLATYLMYAGEDDDCLAAWSLIVPTTDAQPEEESMEDMPSQELTGPLSSFCDGYCGKRWSFADDIYACRQCDDIWFDLPCLNKLRAGTLDGKVCGKDHEMLHVPAYDAVEMEKIGDGNVKVGEQIMTVEEWIQRIKENWGIKSG
jgi:tetratricopeptide (TPR) repeat protein